MLTPNDFYYNLHKIQKVVKDDNTVKKYYEGRQRPPAWP